MWIGHFEEVGVLPIESTYEIDLVLEDEFEFLFQTEESIRHTWAEILKLIEEIQVAY